MQGILAELAQGNSRPLVENMAGDFCWTVTGTTPWSRTYRGKRAVLDELLRPLAARFATRYCWVCRSGLLDFLGFYLYPTNTMDARTTGGRARNTRQAPGPAARRLLDGIQLLVRRFAISERADVSCCGLTVAQSATLDALHAEGPLRLTALGRRLGITPSTLTRNLDRLEQAGLVAREADPEDARAARVRLTPAGIASAAQVDRREEAFACAVLERLPAERRQAALDGLFDLLVAVREATEGCCPGAFDHLMTDFPGSACCPPGPDGGSDGCH